MGGRPKQEMICGGVKCEERGPGGEGPPYWCPPCGKEYISYATYRQHLSNQKRRQSREEKESIKDIKFECNLCKKPFTIIDSLRKHQSRIHNFNYKTDAFFCSNECGKTFKSIDGLRNHVKQCMGKKVLVNKDKKFCEPYETFLTTGHFSDKQQALLHKVLIRFHEVIAQHEQGQYYYVYALMDPRQLPEAMKTFIAETIGNETTLRDYSTAKVYIGKGRYDRRYHHYRLNDDELEVTDIMVNHLNEPKSDSFRSDDSDNDGSDSSHNSRNQTNETQNKYKKEINTYLLNLFNEVEKTDKSLIAFMMFDSLSEEECEYREACIIKALCINNLANKQQGNITSENSLAKELGREFETDEVMELLGSHFLREGHKVFIGKTNLNHLMVRRNVLRKNIVKKTGKKTGKKTEAKSAPKSAKSMTNKTEKKSGNRLSPRKRLRVGND